MNSKLVLQCCCGKAGTYLLYKIVSGILIKNGIYESYFKKSGIGELIDRFSSDLKRFPEINLTDQLRFEDGHWGVTFPHPDFKFISADLNMILENSTYAISHETPDTIDSILLSFSHPIYLLRDGRSVINSLIHFLTHPISLKMCPQYKITDPVELYANLACFESYVRYWNSHVESYLNHQSSYFTVRYEDLVNNKTEEIDRISAYLGLESDSKKLSQLTSFENMKKSAEAHLRKGVSDNWAEYFTPKHKEIFKSIAGETLVKTGYSIDNNW